MTHDDLPEFCYPWEGLESFLPSIGCNHLHLLAYGSLMNRESASLTMQSESDPSFTPAIGFGIKRLFNYRMPQNSQTRHGEPFSPRHVAALNVVSSADAQDSVNGVLLSVEFTNVEQLRHREIGYNLVPIKAETWESKKIVAQPVYTLECTDTDDDILPHIRYLQICEAAARAVSVEFLDYFRRTTFLADGTPLPNWIETQNG